MATNPKIRMHMLGNQRYAKYTDEAKSFSHTIKMKAQRPFSLVEFEITNGPHKGKKGFTYEQTSYFPFERLLPKLRHAVYQLVFASKDPVFLCKQRHGRLIRPYRRGPNQLPRWTSLLLVNRAVGSEAKQVLWQSQHFIIDSTAFAVDYLLLGMSDGCRQITRLTVTKSGPMIATNFYKLLGVATRLRCLTVTLPSTVRMPLEEHIDRHYASLLLYLAAKGTQREETLRRLDTVCFEIGPLQRSFLNSKGEPYKTMTPELTNWCKRRIRKRLLKQFPQ